ncbi:MAG: hypothetical protein Q9187_009418, partial [Circinaria calcarea]
ARAQRPAPTGSFDRLAGVRAPKPAPPIETPSATTALTAPELPERLKPQPPTISLPVQTKGPLTNGTSNSANHLVHTANQKPSPFSIVPLTNTQPLRLTPENATDLHLLTKEEAELCSVLRLMPKAYLVIKEGLIREAVKAGGVLKKKVAREICKIDVSKSSRIFDFFVHSGWIQKA